MCLHVPSPAWEGTCDMTLLILSNTKAFVHFDFNFFLCFLWLES